LYHYDWKWKTIQVTPTLVEPQILAEAIFNGCHSRASGGYAGIMARLGALNKYLSLVFIDRLSYPVVPGSLINSECEQSVKDFNIESESGATD
jgi:hypothetical protein